jgi:hypothetical protein
MIWARMTFKIGNSSRSRRMASPANSAESRHIAFRWWRGGHHSVLIDKTFAVELINGERFEGTYRRFIPLTSG